MAFDFSSFIKDGPVDKDLRNEVHAEKVRAARNAGLPSDVFLDTFAHYVRATQADEKDFDAVSQAMDCIISDVRRAPAVVSALMAVMEASERLVPMEAEGAISPNRLSTLMVAALGLYLGRVAARADMDADQLNGFVTGTCGMLNDLIRCYKITDDVDHDTEDEALKTFGCGCCSTHQIDQYYKSVNRSIGRVIYREATKGSIINLEQAAKTLTGIDPEIMAEHIKARDEFTSGRDA